MIRRARYLWARQRNNQEQLSTFYQGGFVASGVRADHAPLLALDLELTGLSAAQDKILSIACVPIDEGLIRLDQAWHQLVRIDGDVGDSCTVHGIRDIDMAQGLPLQQALEALLPRLSGRVLVCHNATLDLAFLHKGLQQCFGETLPLEAVDTLLLEQKRLAGRGETPKSDSLRLGNCRERYNLPNYPGHNALIDALACGELLLAQLAAIGGRKGVSLGSVLSA
ncbi:exonuclease domain-containing protein [Ferrimonas marina]|uniref:DNA polymerase-3 subunit epsilon n=1 Tax=Ferrimonas marina TaxID=299255 RepID=A0A1M5YWC8_9GAMM|nr:exonuclease domain-containing protein [Ferrimonas marina]SHI16130.1 DNA polymerase-3 subunit epsilon [Ferrimonas marina]